MRTLPPQKLRASDWSPVKDQVERFLYRVLFAPVLVLLGEAGPELKNDTAGALVTALTTGRVQYVDGVFSGRFSAAISKDLRALGATFHKPSGTYKANPLSVPANIRAAAASYQMRIRAVHDGIMSRLDAVLPQVGKEVALAKWDVEEAMGGVKRGFRDVAAELEILPELDVASEMRLRQEYTDSLKLAVKDFTTKMTGELRQVTEANALQGYRSDRLADQLRAKWGITRRKAEFLARQETSLYMSSFRRQRFSEAGLTHYKWSTSGDERVRHDHKVLNGRIFAYDQPPITNRTSGAVNNPGQDYGCRCVDLPVLDAAAARAADQRREAAKRQEVAA